LERAKKTMVAFEEFAQSFPFANPRVALWKGSFFYLKGNQKKAEAEWTKSLESARNLKLPFEEAYTLYHRAFICSKTEEIKSITSKYPFLNSISMDLETLTTDLRQTTVIHQ